LVYRAARIKRKTERGRRQLRRRRRDSRV